jgi:hypothetical protein
MTDSVGDWSWLLSHREDYRVNHVDDTIIGQDIGDQNGRIIDLDTAICFDGYLDL